MPASTAFDKLAAHWDSEHGPHSPNARRFHDRIAFLRAFCVRHRPERALEIGCGTGLNLIAIADLVPFGLGIDSAPAMIDRALANATRHETPGLRFVTRDALTLTAGEIGRFDLVLLVGALEHMPQQQAALQTAGALLAPGGCVLTIMPHPWKPHNLLFGHPRVDARPIATRLLSPWRLGRMANEANLAMTALYSLTRPNWFSPSDRGASSWHSLPPGRLGSLYAAAGEAYAAELREREAPVAAD